MYKTSTFNNLSVNERPTTRLTSDANSTTIEELLAILIGGAHQLEAARALVNKFGDLRSIVNASAKEIAEIDAIGFQIAHRIKAAVTLGTRVEHEQSFNKLITCPSDAVALVESQMWNLTQEELWIAILNTRNVPVGVKKIYKGTVNSCNVRPAEIFRVAIIENASVITIFHNHPSGDPTPSTDDLKLTQLLCNLGSELDLKVLDHIIIAGINKFYSIKSHHSTFFK